VAAGAASVDAGAAAESVDAGAGVSVLAGAVVLVLLVVDGSAGLGSLPPHAARTAIAERTKSFFIVIASRAGVFRRLEGIRQGKVALWHGVSCFETIFAR